jgi:haloalkane dehalogenase
MHYLDEGAGDPVVMVHGNPSWSFYYRNLVRALSGDHRCIVPDHIGCGLSDKPDDDDYSYTLEQRVEDLTTLLDQAGVTERVTLVLHDWGGMIGMAWAHRHRERVARLILLNTAAFPMPGKRGLPFALKLTRTPLGALLVRGLNAFSAGAARLCFERPVSADVRRAYQAPYDSWSNRIATLRFVEDIPLSPAHPSYGLVAEVEAGLGAFAEIPTLICWGAKDFVFDERFLARWKELMPHAEVHRFGDCGHYVLEDAGEEITALTRDFMARHPLSAAP